jgi:uncharacterized membrane protein (UPF0182 family)
VEPVYLRAEQSELPELKRVIVGYQDNIAMGLNLEGALTKLFGERTPLIAEAVEGAEETPVPVLRTVRELVAKAQEYYADAQRKLSEGDFAGYGSVIKNLENVLKELVEQTE